MNAFNTPKCARGAKTSIKELANMRKNDGQLNGSSGSVRDPERLRAARRDHKENADFYLGVAVEAAKNATESDCAGCLGKIGVQSCLLKSGAPLSPKDIYPENHGVRSRLYNALDGSVSRGSKHDPEIARIFEQDNPPEDTGIVQQARVHQDIYEQSEIERGVDPSFFDGFAS